MRCGSGLKILKKEDNINCIIIAGMGGMLMLDILQNGCIDDVTQLVLQPQKDIPEVRRYIHFAGYKIENETMIIEDEKYYNIISAVKGTETYTDTEYELGKILIENRDQTLRIWLKTEIDRIEALLGVMNGEKLDAAQKKLNLYKEVFVCL